MSFFTDIRVVVCQFTQGGTCILLVVLFFNKIKLLFYYKIHIYSINDDQS